MKVAIITYVAGQSSDILAEALNNNGVKTDVFRLKKVDKYDCTAYDWVFSYGASAHTLHKNRINHFAAVKRCVSKPDTFDCLKKERIKTVDYVLQKPIPKHWDWVVIRDKKDGRRAEGLDYHVNDANVPNGELYSEYFDHKYEYRIMVFRGEVVGRYFKKEEGTEWTFKPQPKQGFELMDSHCVRAAKALGIDYVGFDVVANTKKDFRILEANSAPRITDEAENAIVSFFINL